MSINFKLNGTWELPEPNEDGWYECKTCEDVLNYPDATINRFLENLGRGNIDQRLNIIQHFHESINDKEMRNILLYFKSFTFSYFQAVFGSSDHYEIQRILHFENSGRSRWDIVYFGIELDNFFNYYKIVSLRIMQKSKWRIKKTIFQAETKENNWRNIQHIFEKELVMF